MFVFYDLIFIIFAILSLPYLIFRLARNLRYCQGLGMRFGILPHDALRKLSSQRIIWLHAVSVGEVMGASTLMKSLRDEFPDYRLLISTVTQTGNRVARGLASEEDVVIYFPFDLSFITKRLMRKVSPALFLTVETEIWPNFITTASKRKVPIILVNGRISPRSFRRYRKVKFLLKRVLEKVDLFLMQTEVDRSRIISLGAPLDRVRVTGNMKFDQASLAEIPDEEVARLKGLLKLAEDEPLFVAGSTHPGEEEIVVSAYRNLRRQYRNLKLLLAPRHPERTPKVEKLVKRFGFTPIRVSRLSGERRVRSEERGVFILDTIGQLRSWYGLATLVFVGGSLVPHGGHNPIEPASLSKPILFGPHIFNFQAIADALLERKAAVLVNDRQDLEARSLELLRDHSLGEILGKGARETVELNLGATKRNVNWIKELFDKKLARR